MLRRALALFLIIPSLAYGSIKGSFTFSQGNSSAIASEQSSSHTVLDISISSIKFEKETSPDGDHYSISLPEDFGRSVGAYLGPDNSELPTITRLIAIPFDSHPSIRVINSDFVELNDIILQPADQEALQGLASSAGVNRELVQGEIAGQMRDLMLYAITISPVEYNPQNQSLSVCRELEIEISHSGGQITRYGNTISEAFLPIYRSIVDNPAVFDPIQPTRGAYWIIYPDAFLSNIQPLIDWKKSKGFDVVPITKTMIGTNSHTAIKNYVLTRFDSCTVKPDYITIIGDVLMPNSNGVATYEYGNPFGFGNIESDNYFTFLHGNDYFPEVLIGRICIDYVTELSSYLSKLFSYERHPDLSDPEAYLRGLVVAGSDGGSFVSPRFTKLWCREAMFDHGFVQVDTVFDANAAPYEISDPINAGLAYVNYRGYGSADGWVPPYYSSSDISQLSNAPMFPIMTSIVCGTGDFNDQSDVCFGETWIRANNKGGSGFIGNSNHDAHTRWTNALDVGIYWGLFIEEVSTLAQAELMGKMTLYNAFPEDRLPNGQVELYFNSYNLLGDPEINCWIGIPKTLHTSFPDSISFGQNRVDVHLQDDSGTPVSGGVVCLWKGSEIFTTGFTGDDGDYLFQIAPPATGDMKITIVAQGFVPHEDTITIFNNSVAVGYGSHIIDDDSDGESLGDGDGTINPSERIELRVNLTNFGLTDTAFGVSANVACPTPGITISRSNASYGNIAPGETATPDRPFFVRVDSMIAQGTPVPFILEISDLGGHNWQGIMRLTALAPLMTFESVSVVTSDGDTLIEPDDTCEFYINGRNDGAKSLLNGTAILRTSDPHIMMIDSTAVIGNCPPGETFSINEDHFMFMVDNEVYRGHLLNFEVEFTGLGPQITSTTFAKQVGAVTSSDPIGPDSYGYYCFDNTDLNYPQYPIYNWVDIDVVNWSYVSLADDDFAVIALPFTVKYYGEYYDLATISDNGYMAMGETWFSNFYNCQIPSPQNAKGMVAPFWDDFITNPLRVYYHHDTANGKFIVGWRNALDGDNGRNQTFEIIFLDEAFWPTSTDDNDIIFQYQTASQPFYMSAGICSPDRRDGLGYVFNNAYAPGGAAIINGRAIKFTTGSLYNSAADDVPNPNTYTLLQNYPNPFNAQTLISFNLPTHGHVTLEIFNVLGQKVTTLLDSELESGEHNITWDASAANSGVYFYRLSTTSGVVNRRMTLLK